MIRKIRKNHKLIWLILAILLPVLFIAGIAFRHHEPVNEKIPEELTTRTQSAQKFKNLKSSCPSCLGGEN
jgi:hypothetical protein